MALWVDKYRPTSLDRLSYHQPLSENLKNLAASHDLPHLLFYGPSGAGKKTRIMALLREIYGSSVEKLKIDYKSISTSDKTSKTTEVTTISSNYHVEINPSDVAHEDYYVVRELLKEIAGSQQLDASIRAFKVVVISEADKMTRKAQQALRRIMEKYAANCRYILCCTSISKLLAPIRSRCLAIRVAAPSIDEICEVLQSVAKKESLRLAPELCARIARESNRNLRSALLTLEMCKVQHQSSSLQDGPVPQQDWQRYLCETAAMIIEEQSPQRLLLVRARIYELLGHVIPADVIIKTLTSELIKSVDDQMKIEIVAHAAAYEHRLQKGRKPIYHIEAFVAKLMQIYKQYLMDLME